MLRSSIFLFLTLVLNLYVIEATRYECHTSMGIGCSPCGEGTRCHYCEWCVGYCYNGGLHLDDLKGRTGIRNRREASETGNVTYGSQIMSYKVPYLEMFKDVEHGLMEDVFTETDIVEIFKITSVATAQDCAICNNSKEIAEISSFTETVYVELEEAAATGSWESFKEIALNRTSDTNEKLEELPDTLEILVSPTSPIVMTLNKNREIRNNETGIILTGSKGQTQDGIKQLGGKSVEVLHPDGSPWCVLPDLKVETYGHSQSGLTACGGQKSQRLCYTLSGNGQWVVSHNLNERRKYHTSWNSGKGLFLLGGLNGRNKHSTELGATNRALVNGSMTESFTLKYLSRYDFHCTNLLNSTIFQHSRQSCAIELDSKVVINGGMDNEGKKVASYGVSGFVEQFPDLHNGRYLHGCGHYIDNKNQQVNC